MLDAQAAQALPTAPDGFPIATEALARIRAFYEVEGQIRRPQPDQRIDARREHSRPRAVALHEWLVQKLTLLAPRSKLVEAISYALNGWTDLTRFTDDRRIDLNTNLVERAIRRVALGRKNALAPGRGSGLNLWAIVASLIETVRLNGIEPFAWLCDAQPRMIVGSPAAEVAGLLPIAGALHASFGGGESKRSAFEGNDGKSRRY